MPRYQDDEYGEYYVHIPDEQGRQDLEDILWASNPNDADSHALELFHEAFFDKNEEAYQALIDYIWDEYGFDFEDAFEWEDARDVIERDSPGS